MESLAAVESYDPEVELWPRVARAIWRRPTSLACYHLSGGLRFVVPTLWRRRGSGRRSDPGDLSQGLEIDRAAFGRQQVLHLALQNRLQHLLNHIRRPTPMEPWTSGGRTHCASPAARSSRRLVDRSEARRVRAGAILELPEELRFAVTARSGPSFQSSEIAQLQEISPSECANDSNVPWPQMAKSLEEPTREET